ncbi:translin-like [Ciona intestinalis]
MDGEVGVFGMFRDIESCLKTEHDVKEKIRDNVNDLEQDARRISTILQGIHQPCSAGSTTQQICHQVKAIFDSVRVCYEKLSLLVGKQQYFKYCNLWQGVTTRFSFYLSLVEFLESGTLVERQKVAELMGLSVEKSAGFHLELDDYLCGLLLMAVELSRLAVNCVTAGDFQTPIKISKFVYDLEAGFRLLNLKNDFLRKKYDGLKYDSKKIEQVVYDIKIRGLGPKIEGE